MFPPSYRDALDLYARGFSIIPVPRPRTDAIVGQPGDGKVPAIPWLEFQRRRPTAREIDQWFRTHPMNIAVITGAVSGVVVIDADDRDALGRLTRRLPPTPWQTKTSRGFHLWYRHPGIRVANRARIDFGAGPLPVDVRGDGGFVIAPGSVHASRVVYEWAGNWNEPIERVPTFWPGWLARPSRPNIPGNSRSVQPVGDVSDRARRYLAAIPQPEIGCGSDDAVFRAACRLVCGFNLSASDAEALLWEWAGGRPGWTRDWIARKVTSAERSGSEPIGGLL